jgi:hypothetical protein
MKVNNVKKALSVVLLVAIALPIVAYVYSQTQSYTSTKIPAVLVVRYPVAAQFGIYWNYECTNPVTTIDFGEMPQPRNWIYWSKTMYIKNEQPGKRIWIYWNSTLRYMTTQISESWISNGTIIEANSTYYAYYSISIQPNITIGTYQWTLGVWAEY